MKVKIVGLMALTIMLCLQGFSQEFVSPIGYEETEKNEQLLHAWVKKQVKEEYTAAGITDPHTLKLMESENLKAFEAMRKATNKDLLQTTIQTYCAIGMSSYNTIWLVYKEQNGGQ